LRRGLPPGAGCVDGAAVDQSNQATVVGYSQGSATAGGIDFKGVYMIARLPENISTQLQVVTKALTQGQDITQLEAGTPTTYPARGASPTGTVGNRSLIRFAKIDSNVVTMEFAPEAFNRNEKIIVAVGRNIQTSYQDTSRSVSRTDVSVNNRSTGTNITPPYSTKLIDPAGNSMSTSNSTNSGNIQVNDSLRVATAS